MSHNNLITPAELAERLGVSLVLLWRWRRDGVGPKAIKVGKRGVRYPADEVARWIRKQARGEADQ